MLFHSDPSVLQLLKVLTFSNEIRTKAKDFLYVYNSYQFELMPLAFRFLHAKIVILYVLPYGIVDFQKANCTVLPYVYIWNILLIWLLMFFQKVPLEGDTLALACLSNLDSFMVFALYWNLKKRREDYFFPLENSFFPEGNTSTR